MKQKQRIYLVMISLHSEIRTAMFYKHVELGEGVRVQQQGHSLPRGQFTLKRIGRVKNFKIHHGLRNIKHSTQKTQLNMSYDVQTSAVQHFNPHFNRILYTVPVYNVFLHYTTQHALLIPLIPLIVIKS